MLFMKASRWYYVSEGHKNPLEDIVKGDLSFLHLGIWEEDMCNYLRIPLKLALISYSLVPASKMTFVYHTIPWLLKEL